MRGLNANSINLDCVRFQARGADFSYIYFEPTSPLNSVISKLRSKIDWNYALLITLTSVVAKMQLIYAEHEHNFDIFCNAAVPYLT